MKYLIVVILLLPVFTGPLHAQSRFRTSPQETMKGDLLFSEEKYRDALKEYMRLPQSSEVLKRIGATQIKLWDMYAAIRTLRQAAKKSPRDMEIKGFLAEALSWNKNFGEAAVLYREAISKGDASIQVRLGYARTLSWMKDIAGAIAQYRLAVKQEPENLDAHMGLGQMLSWDKQFDASIAEYRRVAELTAVPEFQSVALARVGQVLVWKGEMDSAQATWNEALHFDPKNVEAMFGLGELHEWSGKYPQAKSYYERILQVRPEHKSAKAKLMQLLWVE